MNEISLIDERDWVDVNEAARLIPMHVNSVRRKIRWGQIEAEKVFDKWIISLDEIDRLIEDRHGKSKLKKI